MKKASLLIINLLLLLVSSNTFAQQDRSFTLGGFVGTSTTTIMTVAQAKNLSDDTEVILQGYIEKHLGGEKYQFRDESGKITVEIDTKRWNGLTISPKDKVELLGEVDKELLSTTIDVKRIKKL